MIVKLIAYGIAREILNGSELNFELSTGDSLAHLRRSLEEKYPDFKSLASLKFAVNERYQTEDFIIKNNDEVVILPPVSGG